MTTDITTGTISDPYLKFDPDSLTDTTALPNATDQTSNEFMFGYDQGGVALRWEFTADATIADGEFNRIELLSGSVSGTYDTTTTLYDQTAAADLNFSSGGTLFPDYIANDLGPYCKLKETSAEDQSGVTREVYLRYVSR